MYGEFKTLAAQESDWMERLEKKLRRSTNTAADAEEISEELDDIENFLNNHPEERIRKLEDLAAELKERRILIGSLDKEAERLKDRWKEVEVKAKKRTKTLEGTFWVVPTLPFVLSDARYRSVVTGSIAEAQKWEYQLIEVQDWLTDEDILLTSHLEQELTVDDLPDESQVGAFLR